jgi:hypothetical protein
MRYIFNLILSLLPKMLKDYESYEQWYKKKYQDEIPNQVKPYLKTFIGDIKEYNSLDPLGEFLVDQMIRSQLNNIFYILNHKPIEIYKPNPVFILSMPRTGSTYFHNLICKINNVSYLNFWEQHEIGRYNNQFLRKLLGRYMLIMQNILSPKLKYIHNVNNEGPEECTKILLSSFIAQIYPIMFKLPNYNKLLKNENYEFTYSFYFKSLSFLNKNSNDLILKAPMHLQSVEMIYKQYPDAKFIFIHRDLKSVLPSAFSLALAYAQLFSKNIDKKYLKESLESRLREDLSKTISFIKENKMNIYHVQYNNFIKDPIEYINKLSKTIGLNEKPEYKIINDNRHKKHTYDREINFDYESFEFYSSFLESLSNEINL